MQSLKLTQAAFFEAVLGNTEPQNERLRVYRNTIMGNYCHALAVTFPGVWQLLGAECADSVAYAFFQQPQNCPNSGCLDDWGSEFPNFLASLEPLKSVPYIHDYAEYEWHKHHVYFAPSTDVLDASTLATLTPEEQTALRFQFLPYVHFYQSEFPLDQIDHLVENPEADGITLSAEPARAIITRSHEGTVTLWVTQSIWEFMNNLREGKTLEAAADEQSQRDPEFDLVSAMQLLFSYPLLAGSQN